MTDAEILAKALSAQQKAGPTAWVEVLIKRMPGNRYKKVMRFRPRQGPYGVIKAITPTGTLVAYEAARIVTFLTPIKQQEIPSRPLMPRTNRIQIHPCISKEYVERITELSIAKNTTISMLIDDALGKYIQQYA